MLVLLIATLVALAVRNYVLVPAFRDQVGVIPFDLQPRLNRETIVIQLGLGPTRHLVDYVRFALGDCLVTGVITAFTFILWRWLFRMAPNRFFAVFRNGGILVVPFIAAAGEISEHALVYRVLTVSERDAFAANVDLLTSLHAIKAAALELRELLTAAFLAVAFVRLLWSRLRASG